MNSQPITFERDMRAFVELADGWRLTGLKRHLVECIFWMRDRTTGWVQVRLDYLAEQLGVCKRQVQRLIDMAVGLGALERRPETKQDKWCAPNSYTVRWPSRAFPRRVGVYRKYATRSFAVGVRDWFERCRAKKARKTGLDIHVHTESRILDSDLFSPSEALEIQGSADAWTVAPDDRERLLAIWMRHEGVP